MVESLKTDPKGFWADKAPCWKLRDCVPEACQQCEAYLDQSRPCWELDTLCKELLDIETCDCCRVYRCYARWRDNASGTQTGAGPHGVDQLDTRSDDH